MKEDDFPDLSVAAKVKESKKEKKKKQTMNLSEFLKGDVGGGAAAVPAFGSRRGGGGGDVDLMSLPTAPRQRVEGEEAPSRHLGGGFREYGGERGCLGWAWAIRTPHRGWRRQGQGSRCMATAATNLKQNAAMVVWRRS